MLGHRDGKPVLVCDGCYAVLGRAVHSSAGGWALRAAGDDPPVKLTKVRARDGRVGEACSEDCAMKFVNSLPPRTARKEET